MTRIISILLLCGLGGAFGVPVRAETVPARETAGAEESRFREERPAAAPEPAPEPEVRAEEPKPPARAADNRRFRFTKVKILGNRSIPESELLPFVEPLANRDITLAELQDAVNAMKKHYRDRGFIAAYVYVPVQRLKDGLLKVDVLEGRIGRLKFAGDGASVGPKLEPYLDLKPGEVITYPKLREAVNRSERLLRDRPKAVLWRGELTGTADVELQIPERRLWGVGLDAANTGTKNTGEYRYGVTLSRRDLLLPFDSVSTRVQAGRDTVAVGADYQATILPSAGTRAAYSFSHADVQVRGQFAPLDIEGDAMTHGVRLEQPVGRLFHFDVTAKTGFDSKRVENRLLGAVTGRDDLSIAWGGLEFDGADARGRTVTQHTVHSGIPDFMGSSRRDDPEMSRRGTGGDFFVYRGSAFRAQRLAPLLSAVLRGAWQVSGDALAPSEQIRLGGSGTVRGYQEGEYLGDTGGWLSAELRVPAFFLPEQWKLGGEKLSDMIQFAGFADAGAAELKRPLAGEKESRTLAGAGAGVRVRFSDKFSGRFDWAFPVGDRPFDNRDRSFYFAVAYEVL